MGGTPQIEVSQVPGRPGAFTGVPGTLLETKICFYLRLKILLGVVLHVPNQRGRALGFTWSHSASRGLAQIHSCWATPPENLKLTRGPGANLIGNIEMEQDDYTPVVKNTFIEGFTPVPNPHEGLKRTLSQPVSPASN